VLLPLVMLYEAASLIYLTNSITGEQQVIKAENMLSKLFAVFGVTGLLAPGLAMLTVFFVWHVTSKERWTIRPWVMVCMVIEAAVWAIPLLVLGALVNKVVATFAVSYDSPVVDTVRPLLAAAAKADPTGGVWQARAAISIGAGLYEELVFRLAGIALVHFVTRDLLRFPQWLAATIAVVGTSAAFAFYHDVYTGRSGLEAIAWSPLAFYFLAGLSFAGLYLWRGFGIVVLTHAVYDLIVLVGLKAL